MKPKTEEFLYLLLWTTELLLRPTFRNLTDSYESWAYRNGLLRELDTLERKRFLQRDSAMPRDRIYRLTEQGRLHALGGRDPDACWSRHWDGRWRLVLFDVPIGQNARRERLRRSLRQLAFGYLQNSAWITPDPLEQISVSLTDIGPDVESLILWDARPCAGESDRDIVAGSWDFERINSQYARYLSVLRQRPKKTPVSDIAAKALRRWAALERACWTDAVSIDPLLPERLLPTGYLGKTAWKERVRTLRDAGRQLRSFRF